MNRIASPHGGVFPWAVRGFDQATSAVTFNAFLLGAMMNTLSFSLGCRGAPQKINAPLALIFFVSATIAPRIVKITTGQLTSALVYPRFSLTVAVFKIIPPTVHLYKLSYFPRHVEVATLLQEQRVQKENNLD